jgi:hypothetical protein
VSKEFKGTIKLDVRDSKAEWTPYEQPKAPQGAPNVLIVLYDDTGLASWAPYEAYRECVLPRMMEKGILPKGTQLTPINPLPEDVLPAGDAVRLWNTLNADEKKQYEDLEQKAAALLAVD